MQKIVIELEQLEEDESLWGLDIYQDDMLVQCLVLESLDKAKDAINDYIK